MTSGYVTSSYSMRESPIRLPEMVHKAVQPGQLGGSIIISENRTRERIR